MSLQGLTVAISPSGLDYFASTLLVPSIAQALSGLAPPDKAIKVPKILISSNTNSTADARPGGWPPPRVTVWAENIVVSLSSGSLSGLTLGKATLSQDSDGHFTLAIDTGRFTVNYTWDEKYDREGCVDGGCSLEKHVHNIYPYSFVVDKMTITLELQLKSSAPGKWELDLLSAAGTASSSSANIPPGSVLNLQSQSCFKTEVSQTTLQAIDGIDFKTPITRLIGPLFGSIPSSGELSPDVVFEFPLGPSGVSFPGGAGVAAGVTGDATYKGTTYPGTNPPQLAVPAVPTTHHLAYEVSGYTFEALLWAFFEAGELEVTATQANIPDPADLDTSNYQNTPLQALYDAYPDTPMSATIEATAAPTVTFQGVYELTTQSMAQLKPQLPSGVYSKLKGLENQVFLDESSFFTQLENVLGATDAGQYKTVIEAAASTFGAAVQHSDQVVINVISDGKTIPVITFDVSQTDVLRDLALGVSGTTQTIQFSFHSIVGLTTTKFVSSTISGIKGGQVFTDIWNFVLEPTFDTELEKLGKTGVPLPRIKGFDFLFTEATLTLAAGYLAVVTDVQHVTGKALDYLLSKRVAAA